jgi:predicted nucleic acid-binding protein
MRVYLDNCCFNRPFDDQTQERVRIEAEAKLRVQDCVRVGVLDLIWSFMLDIENAASPFLERRAAIAVWEFIAIVKVDLTNEIQQSGDLLTALGVKTKDALHLACALAAGCEYFLSTDDRLLRCGKKLTGMKVVSPVEFLKEVDL